MENFISLSTIRPSQILQGSCFDTGSECVWKPRKNLLPVCQTIDYLVHFFLTRTNKPKPILLKREHMDRDQRSFGQFNSSQFQSGHFNSDTGGCSGIQGRSCSRRGQCAGCLGLFTCHVELGKCQMKGLSQRTESKFFQTLNEAQSR
ncbi:uncharacterized protein LOC105005609 isoform X4 [Esox lucius]|uniref:uncharacterized protein LOC105005609 isoform X4 n=1 Tax=Esox lucius TaxID=8010 RepID=UPI0014773A25|nr:uncharacterized protein LOC105005609 isoform X4 [Esox lucius]